MSNKDINEVCLATALQWQEEEKQIRAKLQTNPSTLSIEEMIEAMEQAKELHEKLKQLQNRLIK